MYFSLAGKRIMHVGLRTNCSAVQFHPCHPHFNSPWDIVPPTEEMQDKTCKRREEMSFSVTGQLQPATSDECGSRSHQLSVNFSGWRGFFLNAFAHMHFVCAHQEKCFLSVTCNLLQKLEWWISWMTSCMLCSYCALSPAQRRRKHFCWQSALL